MFEVFENHRYSRHPDFDEPGTLIFFVCGWAGGLFRNSKGLTMYQQIGRDLKRGTQSDIIDYANIKKKGIDLILKEAKTAGGKTSRSRENM